MLAPSQKSRQILAKLVKRAEHHLARLPEIKKLIRRRDFAAHRLGYSKPNTRRRARIVYDALNPEVDKFYEEIRALTNEVAINVEALRGILPEHEVDRLLGGLHPSFITSTCRVVKQAAQLLEEYSAPITGTTETIAKRGAHPSPAEPLGQTLKKTRDSVYDTQADAAAWISQITKTSASTISRIERGAQKPQKSTEQAIRSYIQNRPLEELPTPKKRPHA